MQDSNEGSDKTGNLAKPGPNQDLNGHFPEMFRTCYFPEIFHDEKSPSVERHFTNVTLHRPNDRTADHTKETRHGIYELFAAWGLVLHLYGGETAISFGCTTNDGASQVLRIENTSTCRFEVHPDVMLQDIFRSIKVSQGSCPAIQDHGKAGKSKSRPYNTAFHIYDRHVKDDQIPSNADEFDLVLMVSLPIEVLEVTLSYRASFLSDKAAANVLYTFGQATRICSQEFHTLVRDMNLLSNWDFEQITQWNDHLPQPVPSCVHSLIEQHVRSQPEAPSIHAWDGKLTYKRLSILSSNLARYLVSIGIGVEQFVPLCFEKSMWAVVSLLAVLKAGAACAFIEPSHPMERIRSMLRSMDAKVVLCSRASSGIFISQPCTITNIIEVDAAFIDTIDLSSHFSPPSVQPTNAAILLFTSGSTGQPKGIVQEHSTTAFSAETLGGFLGIRKGSRCLQWAAYCFDMSVIDMLTALVQGACICIPSEKDRMEKLPEAIRDMRVDNAALTPSFAQTIKSACMPTLKTLVFGGEPVSRDDLIGWPEDVRIINGCGPAEASVCIAGEASLECPAKIGRKALF